MLERIEAWWKAKDKKARRNTIIIGIFLTIIVFAILSSIFGGKGA